MSFDIVTTYRYLLHSEISHKKYLMPNGLIYVEAIWTGTYNNCVLHSASQNQDPNSDSDPDKYSVSQYTTCFLTNNESVDQILMEMKLKPREYEVLNVSYEPLVYYDVSKPFESFRIPPPETFEIPQSEHSTDDICEYIIRLMDE